MYRPTFSTCHINEQLGEICVLHGVNIKNSVLVEILFDEVIDMMKPPTATSPVTGHSL